jgi:DNA polymerase III delta prime subunit
MKKKSQILLIILIILTIILTVASNPISNLIELPLAIKPFALPLLIGIALLLCMIAVWQFILTSRENISLRAPSKQNRLRLLTKVRETWITGVLDNSLKDQALISLGLQHMPDALVNSWYLALEHPNQPTQVLPPQTSIIEVYKKAVGELLILGEPGAGKTTLLLELCRKLLNDAQTDESQPIPIVFNLSSWALNQHPLAEWMVEEITTKYNVPNTLALAYLASDQVLPLLDGLDEVAEKNRTACIKAINEYHKVHDTPLVVCSRRTEYIALTDQAQLRAAVLIQPLTSEQVEQNLSQAKQQLAGALAAYRVDLKLQELITTPLMLNILTIAYAGISKPPTSSDASLEEHRQKIFTIYIERVLHRKAGSPKYSPEQVIKQLSWLAWNMKRSYRKEFESSFWKYHDDDILLDWLPDNRSRKLYQFVNKILEGLIWGLTLGMFGGLVILLFACLWDVSLNIAFNRPFIGLSIGLGVGTVSGLLVGYLNFQVKALAQAETYKLCLVFGIIGFLLISFCILYFVLGGLLGVLLGSLIGYKLVGIFIGIVVFLLGAIIFHVKLLGKALYLIFILSVAITGTAFEGERYYTLLPRAKIFIVRLLLACTKTFPMNYSRFLGYAKERILLRKIGPDYIFIHQLLLEHFAALYHPTSPERGKSDRIVDE